MQEEGIWISPALVSSQIAQWLVCLAVPVFFVYAVRSIDEWNIFDPDVKNEEYVTQFFCCSANHNSSHSFLFVFTQELRLA